MHQQVFMQKIIIPCVVFLFYSIIQSTNTPIPEHIYESYAHLVELIHNADVDGFKNAYTATIISPEDSAALQHVVVTRKKEIIRELKTLDTDKNLFKLAQGSLATILAGVPMLFTMWADLDCVKAILNSHGRIRIYHGNGEIDDNEDSLLDVLKRRKKECLIIALCSTLVYALGYKGLSYGCKKLTDGWHYKEYLQNQITQLDAIAQYINAPHSIITGEALISYIKNVDFEAFSRELQELITLNKTAAKPYITQPNLIELEQCALETKKSLQQELLAALSQNITLDWKKLIGGSMICLPSGFFGFTSLMELFDRGIYIQRGDTNYSLRITPTALWTTIIAYLTCKAYAYGAQTIHDGWHYQQYIREQLKSIDMIIEQIETAQKAL
jgi:hypothetical protein